MKISYNNLDIEFTMDYLSFYTIHIVFERFLRSIPSHSHSDNSYEIHYIPEGRGKVKIDQVVYPVVPNTLYVTGPHVEHEQIPSETELMEEYCIYFKLQNGTESNKSHQESVMNKFEKTHFWFGQDTQDLHSIMKRIFFELEHRYEGYMIMVETLLQHCVISIVRNYEGMNQSKVHFSSSNLSDSKYIVAEETFLYEYKTLTLRALSARLGLSIRQTERFLKNNYGKTFIQKREDARMSAAKTLLNDRSLSISEVAERLNYSCIQHFSYSFKHYYGFTASIYRKNYCDKE
jgi:AraC-like DNA-binding protein